MKFVMLLFICVFSLCFAGCNISNSDDVLRIHIRANSNTIADQEIKLKVRDGVVNYITPLLSKCNNCEEVKNTITLNLSQIKNVSENILRENGFDYDVVAKINNEYFPSRDYLGKTFPADYYDALIIELGGGKGDNWWCVAYPPLCFVGYENEISGNIQYKSKIVELIKNFFGE